MNSIRRCGVVIFVHLALLASTTCGKDGPTETSPPTPPPPPPATSIATRIVITPSSFTFNAIGQTQQLAATVYDQYNTVMASASVFWSSGDAAVASVDSSQGLVTAAGNGTTRVTAHSGNVQTNVDVTVAQAAYRIVIEPGPSIILSIGATIQLTAAVLDRNDHPVMSAVATWSSGDSTVVAVSPEGLVTAAGEGRTRVTARSGNASATAAIIVSDTDPDPVLEALVALYNATDGPNWTNNTNWLSEEPLGTWHGIGVDENGRVIGIELPDNQLSGPIPSELGRLADLTTLSLHSNELTGEIPPELARLVRLEWLDIIYNRLTGEIPPELGRLENLKYLDLFHNQLTGEIPSELGQLVKLTHLGIGGNQLSGAIPSALGQLENLEILSLGENELKGGIPPELARLVRLEWLDITNGRLTGAVPPELGQLKNLEILSLGGNAFTGQIPPELGDLENLRNLSLYGTGLRDYLGDIGLSGEIPPELGQLVRLETLDLHRNQLSGAIPEGLGDLENLQELYLYYNNLSGNVPESLGSLARLRKLHLYGNGGISGVLPSSIFQLMLDELRIGGTGLCLWEDDESRDWLQANPTANVDFCRGFLTETKTVLIQAIQTFDASVPLVAGRDALLRVFIASETDTIAPMPRVTARFFHSGVEVFTAEMENADRFIPSLVYVGDIEATSNAPIPGSIIQPGLEMVIELGSTGRLPASGRRPVEVVDMPPFNLTVVPFYWMDNPDMGLVSTVQGLTEESEYFNASKDRLPVNEFNVEIRSPVAVSFDPISSVKTLDRVAMIRTMDGSSDYYMGIVTGGGGLGRRPGAVTVTELNDAFMAHELGHNLNMLHAPCGTRSFLEHDFPYLDGNIGVWGYDHRNNELVPSSMPDFMSYCGPPDWTSDYSFVRMMNRRLILAGEPVFALPQPPSGRSLLVWGGRDEYGELYLEPAFVVDAPPSLPGERGPYRLAAGDADGNTLFNLSFSMEENDCGEGESGGFVFAVPVRPDWFGRLEHLELYGPEGFAVMTRDDGRSTALLLDRYTGELRGVLDDWPEQGASQQAARRTLPEPGLEVIVSTGIPDPADW
ncbi:MAG: Ig-like domain-containing protein [Gemmatimonadetes bacterium]|nr:Ig-like domain-containing protein [Gemmatimonadota bacterium]